MKRKRTQKTKFPKCGRWPNCACIEQGYINPRERNDCGRKPEKPPRPVIAREHVGWR